MKIEFDALSQKIIIEPYKSWQEKELMLVSSYADIEDDSALDIGLDILKIPQSTIKSLTIQEKKALMYKFREVSVGETIEVKFVCNHCKIPNQATISIKNIIKKPIKKSESIIDLHRLPIDENDLRIGSKKQNLVQISPTAFPKKTAWHNCDNNFHSPSPRCSAIL